MSSFHSFSKQDAETIIKDTCLTLKGRVTKFPLTPDPVELAKSLNRAVRKYEGWRTLDGKQSPKKIKLLKSLKDTEEKTQKLLKIYAQLQHDINLIAPTFPSKDVLASHNFFEEAIITMESLEKNLSNLQTTFNNSDHEVLKYGGLKANTDLIGRILPEVYETHFGKKPTLSRSSEDNKITGPFIRFINGCLKFLELHYKPEGIDAALDACRREAQKHGVAKDKK